MHAPGECAGGSNTGSNREGGRPRTAQANVSERERAPGNDTGKKNAKLSKTKFKAMLSQKLGESNAFNDDMSGLIAAIAEATCE